ncbi:hypothetical protein SAMN04488122_3472 [Chitinophaga arvensicola]|uniref:Uncharacterized protein n=1 Tax=Chitinophaga arvensicola TaxID=29529 RepID=A0A1I0RVE6_9BACT|nr:hypothetical protein SAMN04488122_3472 [Chitinophaga arvensicola]
MQEREFPVKKYHQIRPFTLLRESTVYPEEAGLLTYNISAALPVLLQTVGILRLKLMSVTYSCATARDLHTVPF